MFSLDPTDDTLLGGRFIPADARIEWTRFFNVGGVVSAVRNVGRRIRHGYQPRRCSSCRSPAWLPGAVSNVLAFRNIVRGLFYELPSYEDVADALGITPVNVAATVGDLCHPGLRRERRSGSACSRSPKRSVSVLARARADLWANHQRSDPHQCGA